MAHAAGVMDFRVIGGNVVAGCRVTAGTVGRHGNPADVRDTGMIIDKGAMTGRASAAAIMATEGRPILATGRADESAVEAMTGATRVMRLRIGRDDRVANRGMTACTVAVHTDNGIVVDGGMVIDKGTMTGRAIIGGGAAGAGFSRGRSNQGAACAVALGTGVMNAIVRAGERNPRRVALGAGMTIGAVGGKRYPEGMVFAAMFGGKEPVTAITARPTALADSDRNQSAGAAMAGGATAMLLGRTAHRDTACSALGSNMTTGAIGREADQGAMILAGVPGCETAMTGIASAAARVTAG